MNNCFFFFFLQPFVCLSSPRVHHCKTLQRCSCTKNFFIQKPLEPSWYISIGVEKEKKWCGHRTRFCSTNKRVFKVENNSFELTRIFKESFKDQRWAWEESVRAEKRDRDAEREKETFRRQRHHQSQWWLMMALTPKRLFLSLSLHLYLSSPPLHFLLTLTFGL